MFSRSSFDEMQVLARGGDFVLLRTDFGHLAVVGQMRDALHIRLAMANVDLLPTESACLVVDCSGSDYEARTLALTIVDWVLERASLEVAEEIWLLPAGDRDVACGKLSERVAARGIAVTYDESNVIAHVQRIRGHTPSRYGELRLSSLLQRAREQAMRADSRSAYADPLRSSDELLRRSAIGEISESIMVTSADLDAPGPNILYVNKAFSDLTGYTSAEVIGRSPRLLQGPRSDRSVLRRLRSDLERHGTFDGETINYRKDGTEFAMQFSVHPLRGDAGEVVRYLSIQRDVTEQRRYESIARGVNMTDNIGMIFSGIRHELGNPVNSIKTALSVLRRQHRDFGPDKTDNYLELIMNEVSRVEFLLHSLRSYTAFERANAEDVDLGAFLRNFERLVRGDLESQRIGFTIVQEPGLSRVRIDPRALNQVLLNLVSNACDALADTERGVVQLVASSAGQRVHLVVRDNGCGMSESHLERLFLPFHTTKDRGTGLGLVIAQKLVTEMGGHIRVASERRSGTDVTIELAREEVTA
jgi:PAS domain S-box-containing protein